MDNRTSLHFTSDSCPKLFQNYLKQLHRNIRSKILPLQGFDNSRKQKALTGFRSLPRVSLCRLRQRKKNSVEVGLRGPRQRLESVCVDE